VRTRQCSSRHSSSPPARSREQMERTSLRQKADILLGTYLALEAMVAKSRLRRLETRHLRRCRLSTEREVDMRAFGPVDDLILWLGAEILILLWFCVTAISLGSYPGRTETGTTTYQVACPNGPGSGCPGNAHLQSENHHQLASRDNAVPAW
jgi:hypothetical protein